MFTKIFKEEFIYIFTYLEIAIFINFKKYIVDQSFFTNSFYFVTIHKFHLVEK